MLYGLYLSAGGMLVQRHQLDVIANNMANVATTSFKRDVAIFRTRSVESQAAPGGMSYRQPVLDLMGGGTFVSPTYTEFQQGEMETTAGPLDIYIKGPGFLPVQQSGGAASQVCYTRDGRLTIDGSNYLATAEGGHLVLDRGGRPIQLDRAKQTLIGTDGTISQEGEVLGQLEVTDFEDPHVLRKIGGNLYANPTGAVGTPKRADLASMALERSTVDPVKELVAMIESQRAYEANARLIQLQDEALGKVINDLPRNL